MKNIHLQTGIGILLTAMLACAHQPEVTLTPLGAERTYPATAETMAIPLYTITKPECPYDEIAALAAEGASSDVVVSALRKSARGVGAHAIIAFTQSNRRSAEGLNDISVRTGTAIRFRSGECMK